MGQYGYSDPNNPNNPNNPGGQNAPNNPNSPAPAQGPQYPAQGTPPQGPQPAQSPQAPYAPAGQPPQPAYPAQPFQPMRQTGAQQAPTGAPAQPVNPAPQYPAYPPSGQPAYTPQPPTPAQGQTPGQPIYSPAPAGPGAQPHYPAAPAQPQSPYAPPGQQGYPAYPLYPGQRAAVNAPPVGAPGPTGGYTAPPLATGAAGNAGYQPFRPPAPSKPPRRPSGRGAAIFAGVGSLALVIVLIASAVLYSIVGSIAYQLGPLVIGPHEQISGAVYGQDLSARENGYTTAKPIAATVTCGKASAQTSASGAFSLSLPAAAKYSCSVTAASYVSQQIVLTGHGAQPLTLNFGKGASSSSACPSQTRNLSVTCAALTLQPATLSGVVSDSATGQGIPDASVLCWNDDAALAASQQTAQPFTTTTDGSGVYTLPNLPPDHYACVGDSAGALHRFTVSSGQHMTLNLSVCTSECPGVTYHQGAVMHTATVYADFWLPRGQKFQPDGNNTRFESLVKQYLNDIGGSQLYNMLTQYWDTAGPVRNNMRFGGAYIDTTPYPHTGTMSDPLTDDDVRASVARAIAANNWSDDHKTDEVIVFTGYNIEECAGDSCTFPDSNGNGFCGYHDITNTGSIYAFISDFQYQDIGQFVYSCVPKTFGLLGPTAQGPIPYGDAFADQVINTLSHEEIESVTDPINGGGWYKGDLNGEVGDLCRDSFGPLNAQGASVTLEHGHSYILQEEFNNLINGCSY